MWYQDNYSQGLISKLAWGLLLLGLYSCVPEVGSEAPLRFVGLSAGENVSLVSPNLVTKTVDEDGELVVDIRLQSLEEQSFENMRVDIRSSKPKLVPEASFNLDLEAVEQSATHIAFQLRVTPAANQTGRSLITLSTSFNGLSATGSFAVVVNAVNDAPSISPIPDVQVQVSDVANSVSFRVSDIDTASSDLRIRASSSNQGLVNDSDLLITSDSDGSTLSIRHQAGEIGETSISVVVTDGENSVSESFRYRVNASPFHVELLFLDENLSSSQRQSFLQAAQQWSSVIQSDLENRILAGTQCNGEFEYSGEVDDILIGVISTVLDGPNGTLGRAGPCSIRRADGLPFTGIMHFDLSDIVRLEGHGLLTDTIYHEMGHVLGFGTLWNSKNLLDTRNSNEPRFLGRRASFEWQRLGGAGTVPVEATGGTGTALGHWDEAAFRNELMTGWLNDGTNNPLSRVSVASMEDLGYSVDYDRAEAFSLASNRSFQFVEPLRSLNVLLLEPTEVVD